MIRANLVEKGLDYNDFDVVKVWAGSENNNTYTGTIVGHLYLLITSSNITSHSGFDFLRENQGVNDKFSIIEATATTINFTDTTTGDDQYLVDLGIKP